MDYTIGYILMGILAITTLIWILLSRNQIMQFFKQLFRITPLEVYYQRKNYIGMREWLKFCTCIEISNRCKVQMDVSEICKWAGIANNDKWIDLTKPEVIKALEYLKTQKISVNIHSNASGIITGYNLFEIDLQNVPKKHYKKIHKNNFLDADRLMQFVDKMKSNPFDTD